MAKHPTQHHDEPEDRALPTTVDRLTALIAAMEHGSQNNAPISLHMIRELTDIRDALK